LINYYINLLLAPISQAS